MTDGLGGGRTSARDAAEGLRDRFLLDAGAMTASGLAAAVIMILQGVLLARWLGPRGYGTVAVVSAYPAVVLALLSADSPHATVRYLADRDAAGDAEGALAVCRIAYVVDLVVGLLTVILVAATATWAEGHVLHVDGTAGLLVLMALALLLAAPAHAATATLMHAGRFRTIAVEQVANAALRSALMVGFVAAGEGAAGAIWGAAIGFAFHGVVLSAIAAAEERRRWSGSWLRHGDTRRLGPQRAEMLRFLAWTDLGALLGTLIKQVDVLVLGAIAGPSEAGFYRLARSISGLPGYLVAPLQSAVYPRLAKSWAEGGRDLPALVRRHATLGAGIAGLGILGLVALRPLVVLAVGDRYDPAIGMAQALLAGALVWAACYWLRPLFLAAGRVRAWVVISGAGVACALVMFWPAAVWWGGLGLSLVQLVAAVGAHGVALTRLPQLIAPSREAGGMRTVAP